MSWQAYVDQQLVGTGYVTVGAILGLDGSTWAASPSFTISAAEGKALAAGFASPDSIVATGFSLAGTRYLTIRADNRSVYGKKGATGVSTVKTNQGIIVGVYNESIQPGQNANVVEKLADYLIGCGY